VGIRACRNTVEMDMLDFAREMVFYEREYYALGEGTRAQLTFQQFVSIKNPRWIKDEVTHWVNIVEENRAAAARWREAQINPTPIRSRQRCYSCKVPWELDHRCRGKSKKQIIEVHYDSDDEEMHGDPTIDSYLGQLDGTSDSCTLVGASDSCALGEDSDPCALEEQWDGRDDSTCASAVISHSVDDLTPQQSGDTSGGSHVLAPRPDELPMMTMTHLTPMIAMTHEDIIGISDMMEEPFVRDAHQGHMDPQTQEERHDVQKVDLTYTYQSEESGSLLLETPSFDQIGEADSLLGHLLPGPVDNDEDALLIGRDGHSMCLDTFVWDPGADDRSKVSAQEDTAAHTGYRAIRRELAVGDDVQWLTGGPSSTVDRGQFNALSFAESVVGNSEVDTGNEGHEVAPQHDYDQESRYLAGQLRVSEDMIMAATRRIDDTHALVANCCWRASMAHDSSDGGFAIDDFHTLKERVSMMRTNYQQLLMDRDYLLGVGKMYHRALRE
jgi:hypothetical protein